MCPQSNCEKNTNTENTKMLIRIRFGFMLGDHNGLAITKKTISYTFSLLNLFYFCPSSSIHCYLTLSLMLIVAILNIFQSTVLNYCHETNY